MSRQVPTHISKIIGLNLRSARTARGLTQHQLAMQAGTQAFQVSRWEQGLHRPKDQMLMALAHVLDVEFVDFFIEPEREAA